MNGLDELAGRVARWRGEGARVVLCHGCFDPFHIGHLYHFRAARRLGDRLVVTVTPDRFVRKGPGRPLFPETARLELIRELRVVDAAGLSEWDSAVEVIRCLRPAVFAKGADYRDRATCNPNIAAEEAAVTELGGTLAYTDEPQFSSTALIDWVRRAPG